MLMIMILSGSFAIFWIFKCQPSVYFDTYDKLLMGIPGMEEAVDDNQKFYF